MTPSGKLDRKALPPPDARSSESGGFESHVQPRTRTEEMLVGIWRELLKLNRIGVHDNFFEIGGHSLTVVRVINRINQAFGLSLGVLELFQNPTVEKLARVVAAQKSTSERHTRVVQFQQGEVEPSVYFIYAGPDEFRIAELMRGRHPTFGIQVPFPMAWREAVANNRTAAFPSMEQLVAPFVEALSSHMRFSSCVLAGYSFAGLMAFEAAHQFQRQGGKVDMVMLFDTLARHPTAREVVSHKLRQDWKQIPKGAFYKLTFTFDWIFSNSWLATQWMLKQGAAIRSRQPQAGELALTSILDEQGLPVPFELLERLYRNITKSYCPRRLDSRGVLFRSEPLTLTGEYSRERLSRALDDSLGWKNLFAEGLELIPVPGDHLSMIRQPHWALAHQMNEMLKRYWTHADRR